ncbi:MAG: PHP domain-containing protein [Spirochaetia bacterium]|nr:PHP domain-containing protein [Spirochaetia bacterium]
MSHPELWADLHIHTTKSDGSNTVEEIFTYARAEGLSAIAITDHDTVAAVDEARAMEKKYGVEFIIGVELSAVYEGREVHIIGLGFNPYGRNFQEKLAYFQKRRAERAKKIMKKLKENGVNVAYEDLYEITENMNNAGRLHIAKLLVKRNAASCIKDAFNRYLAEGRPAYVEKARITVKDAIDIIKEVGGLAMLAHPGILQRDDMIPQWKQEGLDGLEAFHPDHNYEEMGKYMGIAQKLGIMISGGSDTHGNGKDHTKLGRVKLPYEYYEKIKNKTKSGAVK